MVLVLNLSSLFRYSLVSFERFAPSSEIPKFFTSVLLLVFKLSNLSRHSVVSFERFAPLEKNLGISEEGAKRSKKTREFGD